MSISDIRQKYPQYGEVPDDVLVDSLYNKFYAGKIDRDEFNSKIGYSPEPVKGGGVAGWAKDLGLSALSGATWVPEAVVGLADLAANPKRRFIESWTGQEQETFTRGLAKMGIDFGRAQEVAADLKTDKAKQAREDVDTAFKEGGLLEGLKTLGKNPSLALNAAIESMPSMLSLAGLTRLAALRIYAQAAKTAPAAEAAAAGKAAVEAAMPRLTAYAAMLEGGQVAGQTGSGFAQEGTLSGREMVSSIGAGATTAAIGQIANKVGSRIGLEDVEATLGAGVGSADNLLTRVAKGGFREGVLEEAPQSATETMWQNFGEEKPILEGSGQAMAEGLVVGGLLGTAAAGGTRGRDNTDEVISRIANEETVESAIDDLNETVDFTLRTVEPGEVLPVEPQGFSREAEIARVDDELRQALYRRDMAWQGKDSAEWRQARNEVAALQAEMEGVRGVEYTPGPIEPAPSLQIPDEAVTPAPVVVAPLLSKTGAPFKTERSASLSATFRNTPGATVVPVDGGFGVQPPAQAPSLGPIDVGQAATMRAIEQAPSNQEWAAFPEESGTLSIPRAEMPQIKAEHRGAMTQFLKGRGIEHAAETVPADSLKPTQAEFSPAKVQSARDYEGGNRSILVSQDGYVVDGHHQWAASLGQDVDIIRINAPIQEVLQAAREFPSSTTAGDKPVLQNRDRSEPAYIEQMTSIAAAPDYSRLGFSRDFGNGAPVVEPGAVIPEEQMGATDRAVTTGGRRIPIQYAVVEADQLLPSNTADGSPVAGYEQGAEGMSRAIAGNGRVAGLKLAHQRGKTAEYVQGIIDDAGLHGISADVVQAMKQPVLVRIMPQDEVTADIGDVSNQVGQATLTGAEQAKNDARRVDLAGLSFSENGDITDTTVMQFIRAMPESERSGLMDGGRPGRKAIDRLESAVFATAYGSDTLVALQAQATDTEARTVMKGLLAAASKMARLSGQDEYDIRGLVIEAAEAAVNARRAGQTLSQFIQQEDMTRTPETQVFLEIFADNIRSAKRIGDQLSSIADKFYAEAVQPSSDMLGEVPRRSRAELLDSISGGRDARTESTPANAANTGEPEGPADAERSGEAWDYEPTESGDTESDPFALETQTEEELAQQDAARRTAEQEEVEAQRRADADEQVDDFNLSGSDSAVDQAESRGQGNIFDSAPAPVKAKTKPRKGKAEEARQASRDVIGAKEGDVVTPSADIGYSEAGGRYRIDSIDSDGTVHVVDESNASRTSWDRADLAKAKRNGVTFERREPGGAKGSDRVEESAGESSNPEVQARRRRYDDSAQGMLDLFAPASIPEKDAEQQVEDNFALRYIHQEVAQLRSGFDKVTTPEEVAHLVASIRKHGQETLMVVVTDDDGNILNVIRHSKGLRASASASPSEIAQAVASTPGAAKIWTAHNHPSGETTPSRADFNIDALLREALDGTGISVEGALTIGAGRGAAIYARINNQDRSEPVEIAPAVRSRTIPVTERILRKREALDPRGRVTSTTIAKGAVSLVKSPNALILLTNQHDVIGSITLTESEMKAIRQNGTARRILATLDSTNTASVIIKTSDKEAAVNLASFIDGSSHARILDWIDGDLNSRSRELSAAIRPTFFSAEPSTLIAPDNTASSSIEAVSRAIAPALESLNQQEGIDVIVLQSVTDMPAEALGDVDPSVRYRGAYHNGTVYLFADNIESGRQAQVTLAHELVGHKGILAGATPEEWAEIRRQIESLLNLRSRTAMDIAAETNRRYSNYKEGSDNWMKEFLAVAAERREKRGRIGSIVAEVKAILRKWLRSLGLRGPFSDSDIELIMQNSERNLRARRGDQGMVDGGAPVMADSEGGSSTPASRDSITNTPAFKRWFGESKVVDADGNPQMMYHGTRSDFSQFRAGGRTRGLIFFTASRDQANRYAEGDGYGNLADFEDQVVFQLFEDENPDVAQGGRVLNPERLAEIAEGYDIPARGDTPAELARSYEAEYALVRDGGSVMPVYLSAQNPHPRMPWREAEKRGSRWFKERGYDGVWIEEEGENVLAVFDPTQIKSAIGNNGDFDPSNPDIRFSQNQAPVTGESVRDMARALEQEYGLDKLSMFHRQTSNTIVVSNIAVPRESQGSGIGSSVMQRITDYADQHGARIALSPGLSDGDLGTTSRARLVRFYKRFGFVENKGRNKDFALSEGMYREPAAGGATSPGALFSQESANTDPSLNKIADRVLAKPGRKTIPDRIREAVGRYSDNWGSWFRQGVVDQYDSIAALEIGLYSELRDAKDSAYKSAAFSKNSDTVMNAAMVDGALSYKNGSIEVVEGTKGLMKIFEPLAKVGLVREWELWAGAVRAKRLMAEGRENLYTQDDIDTILSSVTGAKLKAYQNVHAEWTKYNRGMLDFAQDSGLINAEERALWEHDDYVPFHRVSEMAGGEHSAPRRKMGISGQRSGIERLAGGVEKISIIESMVRNTAALIDSSMKNVAMQRTIGMAVQAGVAEPVQDARISNEEAERRLKDAGIEYTQDTLGAWKGLLAKHDARDGTVSVSVDGKAHRYLVNDPVLLRSMVGLGPTGVEGIMRLLRIPKVLLTEMVTADPSFAIRNLIRDTLSTWVTVHSDVARNPLSGAIKGIVDSYKESPALREMRAQGVGGGGFYDTSPEGARLYLERMSGNRSVRGSLSEMWRSYKSLLGTTETANRLAVYENTLAAGGSRAEAAYQAMDVLNFSRHGEWKAVRMLIQMVPFMNARIQGLDRLHRGAKEGTGGGWAEWNRQFAMKGIMLTSATLALLAANWDNDDYWDLPEWERDTYYHFFVGGEHFRLPKPFEVGAVFSTIPERMFEQFRSDANMKLLGSRMLAMFADTFAMDPTPQFVKPALEVGRNRASFTGNQIVSQGMQYASPEAQYSPYTSKTFIEIADAMPDSAPAWMRSPVKLEHLFRGYMGTLGGYSLSAADYAAREITNAPARPRLRVQDVPVASSFIRDGVGSNKQVGRVYDMSRDVGEVYSAIQKYRKEGRMDKAAELRQDNMDKLRARLSLNKVTSSMSDISSQIKKTYDHPALTPDQKRERIDELTARRNKIAKSYEERYRDRF